MGQGTESCGGYELVHDSYDFVESNEYSIWTGKDGQEYKVSDMSNPHIEACIRLCRMASLNSNFECDADKWEEWVDVFEHVLDERKQSGLYFARKKPVSKIADKLKSFDTLIHEKENKARGAKVELVCWCGTNYHARFSDLKRGWGLSCSKSCAAIKRDFGRKDPVCSVTGNTYKDLLEE